MTRKYTEEVFAQKFWEKVDKESDPSGCWLWTAVKDGKGYGYVRWKGKMRRTHLVSYNLTGNTIPEGLDLAHSEKCKGKKNCCNPDHLTPKTRSENVLDKHRDGTFTVAKLNPDNILEIRRRLADGETHRKIAEDFGVKHTVITNINTGKTWAHV